MLPLIDLPIAWTILVDSLAWSIVQPALAWLSFRVPDRLLDHRAWLFPARAWEMQGTFYQRVFRVRSWKPRLPSGASLFPGTFSTRQLSSTRIGYLERWILESCRSELCHWVAMLPSALFLLWNPPWVSVVTIVYAIAFNAIPIVTSNCNAWRDFSKVTQDLKFKYSITSPTQTLDRPTTYTNTQTHT